MQLEEGLLEPLQEIIEGGGHLAEFVVRIVDFEAVMEVVGGDALCAGVHLIERLEGTTRNGLAGYSSECKGDGNSEQEEEHKAPHVVAERVQAIAKPDNDGAAIHLMDVADHEYFGAVGQL